MKFNTTLIVFGVVSILPVLGIKGSGCSGSALQLTTMRTTPVIPYVYQYVILTGFAVVGGALLANAYMARVLKTVASELESKETIKKFGKNTFFIGISMANAFVSALCGFFLLYYFKVLYGFYLIILGTIFAGVIFGSRKAPYIWITDNEIVIFKSILRNLQIIPKNTIQDIVFNKGSKNVVLLMKDKKKFNLSFLKKEDKNEVVLILSREFL
ncbi:MAG: hypothetical protein PVF58_06110 [Candidatus Methanofastidiosia archaeon]|jgi:hypothetical protein